MLDGYQKWCSQKKRSTKPHSSTTYNDDDRTKCQIGQRLCFAMKPPIHNYITYIKA